MLLRPCFLLSLTVAAAALAAPAKPAQKPKPTPPRAGSKQGVPLRPTAMRRIDPKAASFRKEKGVEARSLIQVPDLGSKRVSGLVTSTLKKVKGVKRVRLVTDRRLAVVDYEPFTVRKDQLGQALSRGGVKATVLQ